MSTRDVWTDDENRSIDFRRPEGVEIQQYEQMVGFLVQDGYVLQEAQNAARVMLIHLRRQLRWNNLSGSQKRWVLHKYGVPTLMEAIKKAEHEYAKLVPQPSSPLRIYDVLIDIYEEHYTPANLWDQSRPRRREENDTYKAKPWMQGESLLKFILRKLGILPIYDDV